MVSPWKKLFPLVALGRVIQSPYTSSYYVWRPSAPLLSVLNKKIYWQGFLPLRGAHVLITCFFEDDNFLFCKANRQHWHWMCRILEIYERASGQRLNMEKTYLFFSHNTLKATKQQILALSGIPSTQKCDHYLGLLALIGRSKTKAFASIKDRVWKRLQDWKLKFLS